MELLGVWDMRGQSQSRTKGWCWQGSNARRIKCRNWSWQERTCVVGSKRKDKTTEQQESLAAKPVSNCLFSLIFCMVQANISVSHSCTWPSPLLLMCSGWKGLHFWLLDTHPIKNIHHIFSIILSGFGFQSWNLPLLLEIWSHLLLEKIIFLLKYFKTELEIH